MDKIAVGFVDTPDINPKVPQQNVKEYLERKDQLVREKLIADEYMKIMQERVLQSQSRYRWPP